MKPSSSPPQPDPILVRFIQQCLGEVSRQASGPPDRSKCFVITQVAHTCIAAELGITNKWLVTIEGEDSGLLEPRLYLKVVPRRTYHFYPPKGKERITLKTSGMPIGLHLMRTVENIVAHYDPLDPDPHALYELWIQEAFQDLEQLSWRTLTKQRGPAGLLNTGLFAKFLGSDTPKLSDHPALMFHGAAMIELDMTNAQSGMSEIINFKAKYASHWPNHYDAVAHYYAAKDKLRSGAKELAVDLLIQSNALAPSKAVSQLYDDITGQPFPGPQWVGQTFTDYSMDDLDSGHGARLSAVCGSMDASELLVICMMGGYRGSPDYDDFMRRYTTMAAFFPNFLFGLHIVTTATKRDSDHPEHYLGEDLARHAGVQMLCLHDYRAFVQRAIKPPKVPTIYLVNNRGQCVSEGSLDGVEVWEALRLAGELRVQNLRG